MRVHCSLTRDAEVLALPDKAHHLLDRSDVHLRQAIYDDAVDTLLTDGQLLLVPSWIS